MSNEKEEAYNNEFHWYWHWQFLSVSIVQLLGNEEDYDGHNTDEQSGQMSIGQLHTHVY